MVDMGSRKKGDRMINKGDKVVINPKYQDAGDAEFDWYAIEDEDGGRLKISPRIGDMIYPVFIMQSKWLQKVAQ